MSKKKPVKYEHLKQWVEDRDARIMQAGCYPAQVVFILEEDLKAFCKAMGLPHMGPLSGGRCYRMAGDDFFAVVLCFKLDSGQLVSTIAHECYHALNFIYKQYGVRHSLGNDEPAAYLIGYMAYWATKFIEEQGYGLKRLDGWDCCGDGQNSGDLRAELSGPQQGRVDGGAEPATGAGGQVPRESTGAARTLLPCGCFGRCIGHDELAHKCPACGEIAPQPPAYHVCTVEMSQCPDCGVQYPVAHGHKCENCHDTTKMKQCDRCGVRYFATHEHSCNKRDVMAWGAKHEQDA